MRIKCFAPESKVFHFKAKQNRARKKVTTFTLISQRFAWFEMRTIKQKHKTNKKHGMVGSESIAENITCVHGKEKKNKNKKRHF